MIIKETTNLDDIKAVLYHPDIYDTISADDSPPIGEIEPPVNDKFLYVGGYVDGEIIALMIYNDYLDGKARKCHVQVLPEFRKEYAKKFGEQSLLFRGTLPLYAKISDLYENVLAFALMNDFKVIDIEKDAHIKNGKTYNVNVLRYK